ncbi:MAG: tetratricopeptide repeat protein [Paludibacter sp.]|nr:tetratricopeptide repeat protein [Paludibacter sp.]
MNRKLSFPPDDDFNDTVKRYENFLTGTATGYFDVEELETIVDYYLRKGRTKDGAKALELGLQLHPQSAALQTKRAKIYLAVGDFKKAFRLLDSLAENDDYELQLLKIEALIKLSREKEAQLLCNSLIKNANDDIDNVCLDIAYIYFGLLNFETSLIYLLKGDEFNKKNIDLLFELAFCYEQIAENEKAIEAYNRIIDVDPFMPEAWFNLGQMYFSIPDYNNALNAYEFSLSLNEHDSLANLQKAHTHFQLGQYEKAIQGYKEFEKYAFEAWQAKLFIGESYEKMEKFDVAVDYYKQALLINPDNFDALTGIGICYLEQEKYALSIEFINKAIEINDEASEAWVYLAEGLIGVNDNENALQAYLKSISIDPEQPDTIMAIANIYMDKDEHQTALMYYLAAYEMDNTLEYIDLFTAAAFFKIKNFTAAKVYLKKATDQNLDAPKLFLEICPEAVNSHFFKK